MLKLKPSWPGSLSLLTRGTGSVSDKGNCIASRHVLVRISNSVPCGIAGADHWECPADADDARSLGRSSTARAQLMCMMFALWLTQHRECPADADDARSLGRSSTARAQLMRMMLVALAVAAQGMPN